MADEFDYVIVGAGSAGCVLANRLSEDPDVTVLLLEAGGRDNDPLISIPLGMGKIHEHTLHDWGYHSEPEPNLGGRRIEAMRGKVLGGSSSINVMAYTRGAPGDYNRWAANGAPGWSYKDVLPYFRRGETWEGGADPWRGGDGPLGTQSARTNDPIFPSWVEAGRQAGWPVTADYNGEHPYGFGRAQYTIRNGRRSSSSRAYLRPAQSRKNLTVRTKVLAHRVVLEGNRAVGVEIEQAGQTSIVRAGREVILAAGAFNTPQLLMLSGIGPAAHLREIGIDVAADLPVGRNLQDHLGVWVTWQRTSPGPFLEQMRFDRMAVAMVQAYLFGTGPGTVVPGGLHAFVRMRDDSTDVRMRDDSTDVRMRDDLTGARMRDDLTGARMQDAPTAPGLDAPDIEFMFRVVPPATRLWFPVVRPAYQDAYAIRPTLLHPKSRGEVLLRSADPRAAPRIVYNFFSHPDDLPVLREAVRRGRDIGAQAAMAPYRGAELAPGPAAQDDASIDAWIRKTTITAHHPASTCPIGAVLDPELRVHGIDALRVVDASAMPDLVSAHINACVLMMAEKGADLIRGNRRGGDLD